jgi:hypothetical protein
LSKVATHALRAQRRYPCHRTRTSASAPPRLPVASRHGLPSAAEAALSRRCPSAPCRHATILRSAQRLVSTDERRSTGRAASTLELHLRRAASAPAKPNSNAASFFGELQLPPSRRHSKSPVTSRAVGLLVYPTLSCQLEPPHRAP